MSLQRFRTHGGHGDPLCISEHQDGEYVLYADHVAAIAEVAGLSDEAIYSDGVQVERARIKQAVEALGPLLDVDKYKGGYDCCGCSSPIDLFADIMSIIDGEGE